MESFDVVVVGARCAGSPLATMLARRGLKICVLDRAHFPSETPSTHMIQSCGVDVLDELRVLDTLMSAGAAPLHRATVASDDVRIHATVDALAAHPVLCLRRLTLDVLLVEAAGAAGVEVRTGVRVNGLLGEGDRVTGVRTDKGDIQARLVVGADGRHSTVADTVGAQEYDVTPPGRMVAWGYFEGVDREGLARFGRMKSLSSCLCKLLCSWGLEVGVDSVGVGQGELGEGLFPVGGDLSFDEASFGFAFGASAEAAFLGAVAGSFVLDVADRQPQELDHRGIVGKVTAVLDDLA